MSRNVAQTLSGLLLLSTALALNKYIDKYVPLDYATAHAEKEIARRSSNFLDDKNIAPLRIRFNAYNRFFHLVLRPISPDSSIFADDFKIFKNNIHHVIRPNLFLYQGYVKGDPKSLVYGSLFDGIFDGHMYLSDGNSFTIEKAAKYYSTNERNASFHSVMYHDNEKHMRSVRPSPVNLRAPYSYRNESLADVATRRARRYTVDKDTMGRYNVRTCSMNLQADHRLYEQILNKEGNKDPFRTLEEIVSIFYIHLRAVNEIYETTNFNGVQGMNFAVKQISVFTRDECSKENSQYRSCKNHTDPAKYLQDFSITDYSRFCLSYSLTYNDFEGGVYGKALMPHSMIGVPKGGLCAAHNIFFVGGRVEHRSTNTGFVTFLSEGKRLPPRLSQQTLAHELGHSFGSDHDDVRNKYHREGTYIMTTTAPWRVGDKPNHFKFSRESIANISAVLDFVLKNPPAVIDSNREDNAQNITVHFSAVPIH